MSENKNPEPGRALVVARQATPEIWQMLTTIASSAYKSRNLGVTSEAEAAMKMLTGHEVGLPPMASLRAIYIVKNKAAIVPKAAWALIIGHPDFAGVVEERLTDDKDRFVGYAITLKRKNGMQARRQFTLSDATRAGLADKDNWKAYPEHCCYWRAMSFVQDTVFPDVGMGLYRADELGANITPEGYVVEGEWATVPIPPPTPTAPVVTLDQLVEKHGADAVMAAAGGRIPATTEEVLAAAAALEGQDAS